MRVAAFRVGTDRRRAWVGSMNPDPESIGITSEMGVVIASPEVAEQVARQMQRDVRSWSGWNVRFGACGDLRWVPGDDVLTRLSVRGNWRRIQALVFAPFPSDPYWATRVRPWWHSGPATFHDRWCSRSRLPAVDCRCADRGRGESRRLGCRQSLNRP